MDRIYWFPYGSMYAIPAICAVIGMIFFNIAAFGCITFKNEISFITDSIHFGTFQYDTYISYKTGYWHVEDENGSCIKFNDNDDSPDLSRLFQFGRFVSIIGSVLTGLIFIVFVITAFFRYTNSKLIFQRIAIGMSIASLFSLLLLVGQWDSKNFLQIATGAILAIIAAVLYAGGAIFIYMFQDILIERITTDSSGGVVPEAPTSKTNGMNTNMKQQDPTDMTTVNYGTEFDV